MTAHTATGRVGSTRPVRRQRWWSTLFAVAVGSLVSVGLGVYGRTHEPTFSAINLAGFSSGTAAEAWLADQRCSPQIHRGPVTPGTRP